MSILTWERVSSLLAYDPVTGLLTWKLSRGRVKAGDVAGCESGAGYLNIRIDGENHRAHRLALFLVNRVWPQTVDHLNGDRSDNRLTNLRDTNHAGNHRNRSRALNNTSGTTGVIWNAARGKWTARIKVNGRTAHLGHFEQKQDAITARLRAQTELGFSKRHGEALPPPGAAPVGTRSRSGKKGIWKNGHGWCAFSRRDGERVYIGQFGTIEEALNAQRHFAGQGIVLTDPGSSLPGSRDDRTHSSHNHAGGGISSRQRATERV